MWPFVPRAAEPSVAHMPRGMPECAWHCRAGPDLRQVQQILSTRRDLIPADIAAELTLLQDRVAPFDGETARNIVRVGWPRRRRRLRQLRHRAAGVGQHRPGACRDPKTTAARWWSRCCAPPSARTDRRRHRAAGKRRRDRRARGTPARTRSARARSSPRSRTPSPPSSTCSARPATPACCAATVDWDDLYVPGGGLDTTAGRR